jgi:hypothetical protein
MKKFFKPMLVAVFLVFFTGSAFALSFGLDVESINFNADEKADVLGAGSSRTSDGKADASFNLTVSGAQAIKEIALKNDTTGKMWSSSPSGSTDLLLVKDSNGNIINSSGSMPLTPVLLQANFKLYINDAVNAIPKDSNFTVIVTLIDNNDVTGKMSVKGLAQPTVQPTVQANSDGGISLFEAKGISGHDFAGMSEKIWSDGKNDHQFTLSLNFSDVTVRAMKITAQTSYRKAEWDTVADNKLPIIAVIDSGNNIMNKTDGTVSFPVKGTATYALLLQDIEGILADPSMRAKITISLSDGRIFEKEAVKGSAVTQKETFKVVYRGTGRYDFVGSNEKMQSNLNADRQIDAAINMSGAVTGVRVKCLSSGRIWDTIEGNGNSLVVLTDDKGNVQNKSDGTISMALNGAKNLSLWFDEEDNRKSGPYSVTFVMSNGQVLEASTGKTATAPAASTVTKEDRAVVFTTSRPTIVNLDLVGKNNKLAANGQKDMALNVKITGKGIVKSMVLKFQNGKGWDTLASYNGRWLLGVRENGKVLSHKNGKVNFPVNGTKTYQLLMQDNGELAKKHGKVYLDVTWGDGEITESFLKW